MEDFERRRRDLRRKLEDSDAELRKKDQELTGTILKDLAVARPAPLTQRPQR